MLRYIVKRVLQAIPLLFVISIVCFALMHLAPYDPVDAITTPKMPQETVLAMKAKYGLDKPVYVQYFLWLKGLVNGELGYSIVTHQSISEDLAVRLPATMRLVLPAYILALFIAIGLGLVAGFKKGKWADKIIDGFCTLGISVPSFWLALLFIFFLGYKLKLFPILGMYTIGMEGNFGDFMRHLIMPCSVLTILFLPELVRYIRSSTIGQLAEDYVMVQNAYGASSTRVLFGHVLKNVLLPVITLLGMSLPIIVTGAFITETIFGWPGVGPYFVRAIQGFDYPVVMAILLLSSSMVILGNLLADVLYCIVDPRIKEMR